MNVSHIKKKKIKKKNVIHEPKLKQWYDTIYTNVCISVIYKKSLIFVYFLFYKYLSSALLLTSDAPEKKVTQKSLEKHYSRLSRLFCLPKKRSLKTV